MKQPKQLLKFCNGCKQERPAKVFHHCKLCNRCRYAANREAHISAAKRRHAKLRDQIFSAYGNICKCCGESRVTMLHLDHVNNDGAEHRRSLTKRWKGAWANRNVGGTHVYAQVVKAGFPPTFQLLCANCNTSKARNGGVCEHLTEGATTRA